MLESNSLKKLVDQELPFDVLSCAYKPYEKCEHDAYMCRECDPDLLTPENL